MIIIRKVPDSLDQTPLSNSAERNIRRSRIVSVAPLLFKKHAAHGHASRLILDGRYTINSPEQVLHQQRGQHLLDQWCISLRIASLAATSINRRRSRINATQTRAMK